MSIKSVAMTFGRRGPSHHGMARYLGADPAADAPPDPCSVQGWYADKPVDPATGKPSTGMGSGTMVALITSGLTLAGIGVGAFATKERRVLGGAVGGLVGFGAAVGVNYYQYDQWKTAGGAKHVKGACDTATATASAPPDTGGGTTPPSGSDIQYGPELPPGSG